MLEEVVQEQSPRATLPNNVEAERVLLGCLILDNRKIDVVLDVFPHAAISALRQDRLPRRRGPRPEPLFFSRSHQIIFAAIHELFDTGRGVDLTTLAEELQHREELDAVGGAPYLAGLEDDIFSLGQVPEYARIIVQKWRLRCLVRASQRIVEEVNNSDSPAQEIVDRAEKLIFEIAQDQTEADFVHIGEPVADQLQEIENLKKGVQGLPGLATGFKELDRMTTGLRPSNLVVLAARPSMGKSALAMNMAAHAAIHLSRPVGIYSLEMSRSELTTRLLCTEAHVSMSRVRGHFHLRRDEMDALHEAGERIERAPLYIDDSSSLSVLEMRARARRLKGRCPDLALIIVDYLQLMCGGAARYDNRQQEVSEISRALKGLARELDVPVLALSQLSRQTEQRRGTRDKLPRLSDLRESGAIEQDADVVLFVHREKSTQHDPEAPNEPELATIRIGKQRNGPIGDFELLFRGDFTQFVNLAT